VPIGRPGYARNCAHSTRLLSPVLDFNVVEEAEDFPYQIGGIILAKPGGVILPKLVYDDFAHN